MRAHITEKKVRIITEKELAPPHFKKETHNRQHNTHTNNTHNTTTHTRTTTTHTRKDETHTYRAKHNVLPVQVRRLAEADEKLRPIGVGTSIGHRQTAPPGVPAGLPAEVLVLKLVSVDGLPTSPVSSGEVATLRGNAKINQSGNAEGKQPGNEESQEGG